MALATPTIAYTDGNAASVNLNANAAAFVTPLNAVTFTLQSTTGVLFADFVIVAPGTPLDGYRPPRWYPGGTNNAAWTVTLPAGPFAFTVNTEVSDGNNSTSNSNVFFSYQKSAGVVHRARGVSAANNESLTAFVSVTGGTIRDGVTYAQGDYVLLAGQTSKSQNGLYVVGPVAAGTAPLFRAPDFSTGTVLSSPVTVEISEGTLFANTTWKITTTGAITVDTTAHDWYPREVTQSVTLTAGTVTISNVPILSTSKTNVVLVRTATGGTVTSTVQYCPTSAGANGLTAGIVGTGSAVVQATVAAGTIANTDTSTLAATVINW